MMKTLQLCTGKIIAGLMLVCALALAVFYFTDLPIAQAVYHPNTAFGIFFDVLSPSIAPMVGLFLICTLYTSGRGRSISQAARITELVLAAVCAVIAVHQFDHYAKTDLPIWGIGLAAAGLLALMLVLTRWIKPDRAQLQQLVISAVVMILTVFLLVQVIKMIWGRRRFFTMDDPLTQFTPWIFPQGGGTGNTYQSFPSGHTANGCALLLVLLFPRAIPALRRVRPLLVVLVTAWIPMMAFSRMLEGKHFASDVTAGLLLALAVFLLVSSEWFRTRTEKLAKKL